MHVEPKHIATGAVMTVLLALFLFWQGDADGMDQQPVQMEQDASDGRAPEQAAKKQMAARYEKIRGMESQVVIEDLRNPFSPAHEKRGEAVAEPTKNEALQGKAAPSKKQDAARQQVAPLPQEAGTAADAGRVTTPVAQSDRQGQMVRRPYWPCAASCRAAWSRSSSCRTAERANRLRSASASSPMRSSRSAGRACGCAGPRARYGWRWPRSAELHRSNA